MDNRSEVRAFLTSRRAKVSPQQAGLPSHGRRRVEGLRRGEVAALAGVSVEYYTRLERGNLAGASDSVLDAIARALQLDDTETAHLHHLARAAAAPPARARRVKTPEVRAPVRRVLEAMTGVPAFVRDHRFDILAANPLGMALYAPMFAGEVLPVNSMRFTFLNPHAQGFYPDWAQVARSAVAALRIAAARNPHDERLAGLIGELSMRSDPFRAWWAAQDVYVHQHGTKRFHHPAIGDLDLDFEAFELPGDQALTLLTYSAEPGTPSGDGLRLLAACNTETSARAWHITE
ncbi:helix-turn-helix domain-containing protein [Nonomuraea guangzhouensis]|uniref:Helix-turn-helix domain-containing protein n=1 Tax=Nonomuraea guangzhouensis TaxID=1291555 RepID=A0ABW4G5X4_9ACTN|nr:helix-turn-helix domain-containing protein [Nonomuraea guangzhouensis]